MSDYERPLNNAVAVTEGVAVAASRSMRAMSTFEAEGQQMLRELIAVEENTFKRATYVSLDVFTTLGEPAKIQAPGVNAQAAVTAEPIRSARVRTSAPNNSNTLKPN